jgi:hypothetical protein
MDIEGKGMVENDFEPLIRQRPNTTIFYIVPLYLWMYDLSSEKNTWFNRWLRRMGEAPVLLDSGLVDITAERMAQYAAYRGYYGAQASSSLRYRKKKADVDYHVSLGEPYHIRRIAYAFADPTLDTTFVVDRSRRLISEGAVFDGEVLKNEMHRIAEEYRSQGYYYFFDNHVTFAADTSLGSHEVDITVEVAQHQASPGNPPQNHRRYYIGQLVVNAEYSPERALSDSAYIATKWDTIHRRSFDMVCQSCVGEGQQPSIKPQVFGINSRVRAGDLYSEQNVVRTYSSLAELQQFGSYHIRFAPIADGEKVDTTYPDTTVLPLHGAMQLSPLKRQSTMYGGEISLSGNGLFGAMATISHRHRNLFHGAEIFNVGLMGAFQKVQLYADAAPQNAYEADLSLSLAIPKFPLTMPAGFYRTVNSPRTKISALGNYQQRPDYTRALVSFGFGFSWRSLGGMLMYEYNPINVDIINVMSITREFEQSIANNLYMRNSYQNTFLLGSASSITYDTRRRNSRSPTQRLLHLSLELKGNMLWLGYKLAGASSEANADGSSTYKVWDTQFAQFTKIDLLYTRHTTLSEASSVAFRALLGVGFAYGNSVSLPFDKMYYSGGANSMRGWQVRTLGPGSFTSDSTNLLNHLADMRMEANAEYRFKLFWKLEGALFLDAGNVWAIREEDEQKIFSVKNFLPQIALNWGAGLRVNFGVLVARIDYGIRLHDPATTGAYFVPPSSWFAGGMNSFFIALNYPF